MHVLSVVGLPPPPPVKDILVAGLGGPLSHRGMHGNSVPCGVMYTFIPVPSGCLNPSIVPHAKDMVGGDT